MPRTYFGSYIFYYLLATNANITLVQFWIFAKIRAFRVGICFCSSLENHFRFNKIVAPKQLFCAKVIKWLYKFTLGAIIYIVII